MKKIRYQYKQITNTQQYSKHRRKASDIKYIVIHWTANKSPGADAMNHYRYLTHATRQGSAHYFVSAKNGIADIVQPIGDSYVAWHCGDRASVRRNPNRNTAVTNRNSIGIEMCVNSDGNLQDTIAATVELTKSLMKKFNVPASMVVRHFDVTGKDCPSVGLAGFSWSKFKADIQKPVIFNVDLSKNSTTKIGQTVPKEESKKEEQVKQKEDITNHWAKDNIERVKDLGIMHGFEDGDFKPDEPVTRAQLAITITRFIDKFDLKVKDSGK